jgi:type II secretory pathway component PulJ
MKIIPSKYKACAKAFAGRSKNCGGFTLIELLVAIFGFTLIAWGMIGLIGNIFAINNEQSGLLKDQGQAMQLALQISTQLRNAQTASNGAYALDQALPQQIIFYSTLNNATTSVDEFRYYVQNGQLWQGITYYNGSSYNTSTEADTIVQKDLANGGNPVFYYYNGSYTGNATQTPLSQPINVATVKFVQVQLQIYNKAGGSKTSNYTVTVGAAIRNLKTNLGQ